MLEYDRNIELKNINLLNEQQNIHQTVCSPQDQSLAQQNDLMNRPSIKGPFRPIRAGTIRGATFAMLSSAIGTGSLNLPLRVHQLGIVPFVLIIFICAYFSYLGMSMIERVIIRTKVTSYSEMVSKAYGESTAKMSQTVLICYAWALCICIQVIFAKFVVQILADVVGLPLYLDRGKQIYNAAGQFFRILISIANIALNWKHFFQSDLRVMLHSLGKFSVSGVVFCMAFILLTAFVGFTKDNNGNRLQYDSILKMDYSHVTLFKQNQTNYILVLFQGLSSIFYTFLNHQFIFPVISHLKKPTRKRVQKIFRLVHLQIIAIYITMGVTGYLLLSQHLDVAPISPLVITSIPTLPLTLGKLTLIGALFFALPLQVFTGRQYIHQALSLDRTNQNIVKINFWMIGSTFLLAIIFQKINMYFGFIGGTIGVMMACIIPLACMSKLVVMSGQDRLKAGFVALISLLLVLGAIQSLINTS